MLPDVMPALRVHLEKEVREEVARDAAAPVPAAALVSIVPVENREAPVVVEVAAPAPLVAVEEVPAPVPAPVEEAPVAV